MEDEDWVCPECGEENSSDPNDETVMCAGCLEEFSWDEVKEKK